MLDYFEVTIPIVALAINMVVQLSVARGKPRWGYLRALVLGFGAGICALSVLEGLSYFYHSAPWQEQIGILLVNMGTYLALAFCFLAFVNLTKTSLRIRLFKELRQSGCGLSMEQIRSLYDDRKIFELRVERLVNNRQVIKRDGRYFVAGYSLWLIAGAVHVAKLLVMSRDTEFTAVPVNQEHAAGGSVELKHQSTLPK